ncbi:hypothetical protein LTR37_011714 [Vermiconidia calcicola]|uniref:Uncharacterized protein n=1 Tax=Vermiconidia calcicola TaxID=1690605 RepID=A0ACC3N1Y5_9PEZI|nr:hypothetical protein LTR37_011714 [Vermiconidia calcicola]
MKVLDMNHQMSNAEVLHFVKKKRQQHDQEDSEARAQGATPAPRPENFLNALEKHERHLTSDAYPYVKNPSAYEGKNQDASQAKFGDAHMEKVQAPLFESYKEKIRQKLLTVKEAQDKLGADQDKKELTETELLMIHNHAPTCVEMLQPMIEEVDDRFTAEELEAIVECIKEVYRVDELKAVREESDDVQDDKIAKIE